MSQIFIPTGRHRFRQLSLQSIGVASTSRLIRIDHGSALLHGGDAGHQVVAWCTAERREQARHIVLPDKRVKIAPKGVGIQDWTLAPLNETVERLLSLPDTGLNEDVDLVLADDR